MQSYGRDWTEQLEQAVTEKKGNKIFLLLSESLT